MKKILFLVMTIAMLPSLAIAHTADIASFHLVDGNDPAQLHISFATAAAENLALVTTEQVTTTSTEQQKIFKERLVQYLKDSIEVVVNGDVIIFGSGQIKVGSHQTDLIFSLKNMPKDIKSLSVKINSFENNSHQNNVFHYINGTVKKKTVLTHANNFSDDIALAPKENIYDWIMTRFDKGQSH
jgi:hypothetical protein